MVFNSDRPVRKTKQQFYIDFFLLLFLAFKLSQSIYRQMLVSWYLTVCRFKTLVMWCVVCSYIYTYVWFHMSTILTHVQRFWQVGLLWVEYQASLPLLIHITLRCWYSKISHMMMCASPGILQVADCVTSLTFLLIKLVVIEMADSCVSLFTQKKTHFIFLCLGRKWG